MFRSLFRRKRTIRVPVENSGHQVREVKLFKRPLSKPSNFISTFLLAYLGFRLLESYTLSDDDKKERVRRMKERSPQLDQWAKEKGLDSMQKQEFSENWKRANEALRKSGANNNNPNNNPDDLLLELMDPENPPDVLSTIKLPIWIREKRSPLYQPDDPEYKDYVRIQSDEKKSAELKKQVGEWAIARLKNPSHEVNLRYIGFQEHVTVVLDLVPQLNPPPLYEIPALILFKDGVGFGWKTLRPELGTRLESMMRPSVTYEAAKASLRAFFTASYAIAKAKFLGSDIVIVQVGHGDTPSPVMSKKEIEKDNDIPPTSQWPINAQAMQELLRAVHNGDTARQRHSDLLKNMPLSVSVQFAAATFRRRQMIGQAQAQQHRARGVIQVRGAIVCMGQRGKYRMDVIAFYLPSEDKFLGPLIVRNAYIVKDYSQWQQLEEKKQREALEKRYPGQIVKANEEPEERAKKTSAGKEKE